MLRPQQNHPKHPNTRLLLVLLRHRFGILTTSQLLVDLAVKIFSIKATWILAHCLVLRFGSKISPKEKARLKMIFLFFKLGKGLVPLESLLPGKKVAVCQTSSSCNLLGPCRFSQRDWPCVFYGTSGPPCLGNLGPERCRLLLGRSSSQDLFFGHECRSTLPRGLTNHGF